MDSVQIEAESFQMELAKTRRKMDSLQKEIDSNYISIGDSNITMPFKFNLPGKQKSSADTIEFVIRKPNLYFEFGKQKAWLQHSDGTVEKKEKEIETYIDSLLADTSKDLYLIQLNRKGEPVYGGYWNKKSYISDVVQFNDRGKPALIWEKTFGTFRMKEFVGDDE